MPRFILPALAALACCLPIFAQEPESGPPPAHPLAVCQVGEGARYAVTGLAEVGGEAIRLKGLVDYTVAANTGEVIVIIAQFKIDALDPEGAVLAPLVHLEEDVTIDLGEDLTPEKLAGDYFRMLLAHGDEEEIGELSIQPLPGVSVGLRGQADPGAGEDEEEEDAGSEEVDERLVFLDLDVECQAVAVTATVAKGGESIREVLRLLAAPDDIPFPGMAGFEVQASMADGGRLRYAADFVGFWPPEG